LSSFPSVAVVILNWNGKKYLEQFLPSVFATVYSNFRVVVIDNASTDDSIAYLQSAYPAVELVLLSQNYGFAKGYNEGLRQITADYYVLLNSDVEVVPNWLTPMVALLEQNDKNAACQPKLLAYHQKDEFEYAGAAGGWIDSLGYPFARGRVFDSCEKDNSQYNDIVEVFWASGAALMIRSHIFHELNGFDDFFFAHQEEIDLCWRIHLAGYKVYCCPAAVVYHVGGGTLPKGNARKTFLNFRNNNIMLAKNLPSSEKWWKLPIRLALDQVTAFKELVGGNTQYFAAIQKAHLAFLKWIFSNKALPEKNATQPMRKIPGVYIGSLVWQYFIKKKKVFSEIVGK
jgi:GT2 family glycosyltransferase